MTFPDAPHPAPRPLRPLPEDATVGGLAFHRLVFARRRSGWWTPLAVGGLALAIYVGLLAVGTIVAIIASLMNPDIAELLLSSGAGVSFDFTQPLLMAALLFTIVAMLPAYWLASLTINGARVGLISSVAGRLRWGWMLLCAAAAIVVALVTTAISWLLPAEQAGEMGDVLRPEDNPQLWASLAVVLLIVPLQAAAEEYVFRGYLMQTIGRWLRHPLFAILLPVPLFVLGHLYDPLGQASVAVFAVAAGWLTWRTGGLEAAISLHVVNNLIAFLLGLAGLSDVNASSPGVGSFVFSVVLVAAYAGVVELLFRRSRMGRTLVITPPVAAPVDARPLDAPSYAAATESASKIV